MTQYTQNIFNIEHCKGLDDCPRAVIDGKSLFQRLINEVDKFNDKHKQKIRKLQPHQRFRISLSHCPNGCSRPQIADFGIIGASVPVATNDSCTGCNKCVDACLENAITIDNSNSPIIDFKKCLYCTQCVYECPCGTLEKGNTGFRISLGGKLGRHPQFGQDLGCIYTTDETIELLVASIKYFIRHIDNGKRFGDIINKTGMDWIPEHLRLSKIVEMTELLRQ